MSRCILLLGLPFGVSACGYLGSARDFDSGTLDPTWVAVRGVRFVPQEEEADCGGAALAMVLEHAGVLSTPQEIMHACGSPTQGLRARDVRELARGKGLAAWLVEGTFEDLEHELSKGRPVIVGVVKPYATGAWTHYEVVVAIRPASRSIVTLDPARGWCVNSFEGFLREWEPARRLTVIVAGKNTKGGDR